MKRRFMPGNVIFPDLFVSCVAKQWEKLLSSPHPDGPAGASGESAPSWNIFLLPAGMARPVFVTLVHPKVPA